MKSPLVAIPVLPSMARPGLDAEVILALKAVDQFIHDMRKDISYPSSVWDEESAVKRYLMYISIMTKSTLSDVVMSALCSNDIMVLIKMRMILEQTTKGAYFNDHSDYALYMTTIGEAKDVYRRLVDADTDHPAISEAKEYLDDAMLKYPNIKNLKPLRFNVLMEHYSSRDDYIWLYGAPSALLHGDPEGLRTVIEVSPTGEQRARAEFPIEQINAMLVDAGSNVMFFCSHFIDRFWSNNNELSAHWKVLNRRFRQFIIKHPYGRDDDAIEAVKRELADH